MHESMIDSDEDFADKLPD